MVQRCGPTSTSRHGTTRLKNWGTSQGTPERIQAGGSVPNRAGSCESENQSARELKATT